MHLEMGNPEPKIEGVKFELNSLYNQYMKIAFLSHWHPGALLRGPGTGPRERLLTLLTAISNVSPQAIVRFVDFLVSFVVPPWKLYLHALIGFKDTFLMKNDNKITALCLCFWTLLLRCFCVVVALLLCLTACYGGF